MTRHIASYTFQYTFKTKEEYSNITAHIHDAINKAVQAAVKDYQDTHEEVESIKGGMVDSVSENVTSFAEESFNAPWFMPLYMTSRLSFAGAMRRWNAHIREQTDRAEFQSCKMLMETDGFDNKMMPKISSTMARNVMDRWRSRIDTAAEQAIMNAFVSAVVVELEGAYEDGVEPETNTEQNMESMLF